jgi:hypothetical protein
MSAHWWWWGLAVGLMAFELTTGTLFLLVLAVGAAVGGLAAFGGLGGTSQILVAAVTALVGWFLLRRFSRAGAGPCLPCNPIRMCCSTSAAGSALTAGSLAGCRASTTVAPPGSGDRPWPCG